MTRLNGWHRLWIVSTFGWFVYVAYWVLMNVSPHHFTDADMIKSIALAALAPPIAVLIVGYGLAWIRRGFRA